MYVKNTWIVLGGIVTGIAVSVSQFEEREQAAIQQKREDAQKLAEEYARGLERQLKTSVSATFALGSFIQVDKYNVTHDNFGSIAKALIESYGGISNLQFQPFGVVQQVFPLAGNEGAIGHALLVDPKRRDGALGTAQSGQLSFVGPLKLIQGGTAVIARHPVYTTSAPKVIPSIQSWWSEWNHKCCQEVEQHSDTLPGPAGKDGEPTHFWGFTAMLTLVSDLFLPLQLGVLEKEYAFQVVNLSPHPSLHSSGVFYHSDDAGPDIELSEPVSASIRYDEAKVHWELRMLPNTGWPSRSADFVVQVIILVVFVTATVVSRLMGAAQAIKLKQTEEAVTRLSQILKDEPQEATTESSPQTQDKEAGSGGGANGECRVQAMERAVDLQQQKSREASEVQGATPVSTGSVVFNTTPLVNPVANNQQNNALSSTVVTPPAQQTASMEQWQQWWHAQQMWQAQHAALYMQYNRQPGNQQA